MARLVAGSFGALLVALCLALPAGAMQDLPDPLRDEQWHLGAVGAPDVWGTTRGSDVVVAVVDTGIQLDHPDLAARLVEGRDFVDPDTPPEDENGHGTLVAGVVAAVADNGVGGSGIAPRALLMPVRVLDGEGRGNPEHVAQGIRWAATNGASVINLSLTETPGGVAPDLGLITTDVELAIKEARDAGVLVVVAAGNDGLRTTPYRAGVPVLVVGASDQDGVAWWNSNRDRRTLLAPGVGVVSTHLDGGYARADGTSFSTPVVSGAAALLLALNPTATPDLIEARLRDTARQTEDGARVVDIASAVSAPPAFVEQVVHQAGGDRDPARTGATEPRLPGTAQQARPALGSAGGTATAPAPLVAVPSPPVVTPLPVAQGAAGSLPSEPSGGATGWPVIAAAALLALLLVGHTTRQAS